MNFKDLFKTKDEATIKEILTRDSVRQVVDDYIHDRLAKTQAIIIISASANGDVDCDMAGLCEAEAIGLMHTMAHRIQHEGVPRR